MKKTLLVAAMMASFTGAAVAQNSVTLYGRAAPAIVYESLKFDDKAAATLGIPQGANTFNQFSTADGYAPGGSLFGFKGVEDLGNGLKASFQFEQGLSTATGAQGNRIATLTVSNTSWGSVGFGKDFTAGSMVLAGISPLGTAYGVGSAQSAFGVFSLNVGNQVKYLSPSISGLRFGASYSFTGVSVRGDDGKALAGTAFGNSTKNRLMQAGLRYANGPVVVAANYTQINPADNAFGVNAKNWVVGGTYDLKAVKLHGAYGQNIDGIISGNVTLASVGGTSGTNFGNIGSGSLVAAGRTNQWMAGLSAPVGAAGRVLFNVSQMSPGGDFNTANTAKQTNAGLAYTYSMSKRTSLYASYSYAQNFAMVDGITVNQIGAGIVHNF